METMGLNEVQLSKELQPDRLYIHNSDGGCLNEVQLSKELQPCDGNGPCLHTSQPQ